MERFSTKITTDYMGIEPSWRVSFPRLLAYLAEGSLLHSEASGYPAEWFAERKRCWLLTGWQVEVYEYPSWHEEITIATWATLFRSFVGRRAFQMTRGEKVLCNANSQWVYMDSEARQPVMVDAEHAANYGGIGGYPIPFVASPPALDESMKKVNVRQYQVKRRDIDTNLHVNNSVYVQWAFDDIDDKVYAEKKACSVQVVYKKECVLGDTVLIETYTNPDNSVFHTRILTPDASQLICAVYSVWE